MLSPYKIVINGLAKINNIIEKMPPTTNEVRDRVEKSFLACFLSFLEIYFAVRTTRKPSCELRTTMLLARDGFFDKRNEVSSLR